MLLMSNMFWPGKQQLISDCLNRAPFLDNEPVSPVEDITGVNPVKKRGLESASALKRSKVLDEIHDAYLGENKSICFARDHVFWPCMTAQIKEKVNSCPTCNVFRNQQQRETLHPYDIPGLLWEVFGTDLTCLFHIKQADDRLLQKQKHPRPRTREGDEVSRITSIKD